MKKVVLVSMPFGALERPALGLSLLKARLEEEGLPCEVRYLNFVFADFVGYGLYREVCQDLPHTAFAGEWTFREALHGEDPAADERYVAEVLEGTFGLDPTVIARLRRVRRLARPYLEHVLLTRSFEDCDLVGFTSTFEQNLASLALARRLKERDPRLKIVFGGANWEGEMGLELHRRYPFVDYVCSGEADETLPALVRRLRSGEAVGGRRALPGLVHRTESGSLSNGPPALVRELDRLPVPDYSDYFQALARSACGVEVVPTLLVETSRGCWWGAKSHCTFCGLNGGTMAFRSKSAERALREIRELVGRWRTEFVEAVDNILDMRYFKDLLPALAEADLGLQMFYEVKANLSRAQLETLRAAGVRRIQPGIESLSDHVLGLMRKGTTGLRNIQLLKWCFELGIQAEWNLLYGFPGETAADYASTLAHLEAIRFLPPPCACGPVRLDRFSPYFERAHEFGLRRLRPLPAYARLYPFPPEALHRIAYYFDYDYDESVDPRGSASEVIRFVEDWRRSPRTGAAPVRRSLGEGALLLEDSRPGARIPRLVLSGPEREAYLFCDEMRHADAVVARVNAACAQGPFDASSVRSHLDSLVENRLMVTDGAHYLSLAIVEPRTAARARPLRDGAAA